MNKEQLIEVVNNSKKDACSFTLICIKIIEESNYGKQKASAVYDLKEEEIMLVVGDRFSSILNNLLGSEPLDSNIIIAFKNQEKQIEVKYYPSD